MQRCVTEKTDVESVDIGAIRLDEKKDDALAVTNTEENA